MNVELVPEPFVEIPAELADQMGIRGGEKVKVTSARADYIAKAMVTKRIKPHEGGRQEDLPDRHSDSLGLQRNCGGRRPRPHKTPANLLTPTVIDPNAYTPEFKGFLVKLEKA